MIDVEKIRADFPYLDSEKVGKEVIYLDTGATSQKPAYVIDAVDEYYRYSNANPHRGAHFLSWKATEAYEETREVVKDFIGARKSSEIVFTRSTTEALNLLAYSYGLNNLKKDDEILITILDHHANLVPWQMVAKKTGAKLVYAYLNDDYGLDYDDLKSKINEKTKIVSVTGASNVTGELIDSKLITKWAHEVGAISIVDGAQLIPHVKTDVEDIDCDFLAFSGHKMFSPMGIGVLYGKYELLDGTNPDVYAYTRALDNEKLLIVCNFTSKELDYPIPEMYKDGSCLISNYPDNTIGNKLRPYEAYVLHIEL